MNESSFVPEAMHSSIVHHLPSSATSSHPMDHAITIIKKRPRRNSAIPAYRTCHCDESSECAHVSMIEVACYRPESTREQTQNRSGWVLNATSSPSKYNLQWKIYIAIVGFWLGKWIRSSMARTYCARLTLECNSSNAILEKSGMKHPTDARTLLCASLWEGCIHSFIYGARTKT